MKCNNCNQEISGKANFCPKCGSALILEPEIIEAVSVDEKSQKALVNPAFANTCIGFGITGLAIAMIISGSPLIFIAGVFGVLAIINGVKSFKVQQSRKATWGTIFGTVAVFLAVVFLVFNITYIIKANKAPRVYSKELNLNIPNKVPEDYYQHSNVFSAYGFKVNYYYISLDHKEASAFTDEIEDDARWRILPFTVVEKVRLRNITDEDFFDFTVNGYFICYNRNNGSYSIPVSDEDYDCILVIYDSENKKIIIYEIWA